MNKLQVVKIVDLDVYEVVLPHVFSSHHFELDGMKLSTGRSLVFKKEELERICSVKTKSKISCYKDEHENTITTDTYNYELQKLSNKGKDLDYEVDFVFDTIEDEVAYKHFIRKWKPHHTNVTTKLLLNTKL